MLKVIQSGTVFDALASTIDPLPTVAAITGTSLPAGRAIDGMDISALLKGDAKSVRDEFLYYAKNGSIEGIREGDWKLLVQQPEGENGPKPSAKPQVLLFNLATSPDTPRRGNWFYSPFKGSERATTVQFKKGGYATGAFGKWGLGTPGSASEPLKMGFDRFYGFNCQRMTHHYYPYFLWNDN